MKTLIAMTFLLLTSSAFANCYEKLTDGYQHDSRAFQLREESVDLNLERGNQAFAVAAVETLYADLGCKEMAVTKQNNESGCQEIVSGRFTSRVCYVETEHGYFLVSVDMLENINIVFNRFD